MLGNTWLNKLEKAGNRLPDPVLLFIYATIVIAMLSELATWQQWQVVNIAGDEDELIVGQSLFTVDGLWWWLSHMVSNFMQFPPLGIVLVGMLGIGLAERSGFLNCLITASSRAMPDRWLIPMTLFLGIMSSFALDAGYVVLPPIAAVLFRGLGHSPITGIVVSFAGVSAGFGANLFITSLDPLLAGFTQSAAQIVDPDYQVAVTANWWFMIASTLLLTMVGTFVTRWWVVPRAAQYPVDMSSMDARLLNSGMDARTRKGLRWALLATGIFASIVVYAVITPQSFLYGAGERFDRWIEVTVPLLFLLFAIPGLVFGRITATIKSSRDFARMLGDTVSDLGPYIVLAFFAAQFIAVFKYTHLGEMFAVSGGSWLSSLELPVYVLIFAFVILVCVGNLLIGSMSAKYALLSPVFVPMLLLADVPAELTQVAYRIGDSVTNVITPLNPFMIIILALLQKYFRNAGLGTLVSLTLPYSLAFLVMWMLLLFFWIAFGIPLGPGSPI